MSLLAHRGIEAADALLKGVFGLSPLAKASSILTPPGFDAVVFGLLREFQKAALGGERKALDGLLKKLDKDWPKMTPETRSQALRDAGKTYLGLTDDIGDQIGSVLKSTGPTIVGNTKRDTSKVNRLGITPSFNAVDQTVIDAAAKHQALFARDEFGRRSERYSLIARDVVSKGLESGLDRYDIGKQLAAAINTTDEGRSESYWTLIASVFAARSRTYGQLSSFAEAGIDTFEFEAVLDEVTSEVCRFMHGKQFSTASALQRFAEVEAAPNPEDVKELQPWASVGKDEDGNAGLFFRQGGARQLLARVETPGVGVKDGVGAYSSAMSSEDMQKAGLSAPPLHGHCRSTIVPVFSSVGGGTAVVPSTIAQPKPLPKPRKPKEPKLPVTQPTASPTNARPTDVVPPPDWAVASKEPGKPPKFIDAAGNKIDPKTLGSGAITAIQTLYDTHPDYLPSMLGLNGVVDDDARFNRKAFEDALRAAIPGGDIAKLASTKGQVVSLHGSDWSGLQSGTLDRAHIAGYIAKPPPNDTKYQPVVVRYNGRTWIESGSDLVVATHLRSQQSSFASPGGPHIDCRIVDLDKCAPAKTLDPKAVKDISQRMATGLNGTLNETDSKLLWQARRQARTATREIIASQGIETRDDYRAPGSLDLKFPINRTNTEMDVLKIEEKMKAGSAAFHTWQGSVSARRSYVLEAQDSFELMAKDPKHYVKLRQTANDSVVNRDLYGVNLLVHEEVHGASNALSISYIDAGRGFEEAATEILARKSTRAFAGFKDPVNSPMGLPEQTPNGSYKQREALGYDRYIETLFDVTAKATGHDNIHARIEGALIKTREWDGARKGWAAPKDQIDAYVAALGLKGADASSLSNALMKSGLKDEP